MSETLETELKKLIVDTLQLEDVAPTDILADAPLFGEGLGLDSLDALDLAVAIEGAYGVKMSKGATHVREAFRSVRTLAAFIAANRAA